MAISPCASRADPRGRELVSHGTALFPAACYHDDLLQTPVPWHWHTELEAGVVTEGGAVIAAGAGGKEAGREDQGHQQADESF